MSLGQLPKAAAKRKARQAAGTVVAAHTGLVLVVTVIVLGLLVLLGGLALLLFLSSGGTTPSSSGQGHTTALAKDAEVPAKYRPMIIQAVHRSGCRKVLTAPILAAQLHHESSWDPKATSGAGAQGIAQFMPATWQSYGVDGDGDQVADVWNPRDAIPAMARYDCAIAKLVRDVTGDPVDNMLAGYNAGPYTVTAAGGVPAIPETRQYVQRIHSTADTWSSGDLHLKEGPAFAGDLGPVIQAARSQMGTPYVFGAGGYHGASHGLEPGVGYDCSGLTSYAFYRASHGQVRLPRTAAQQAQVGEPVPPQLSQMEPGDLVFFALGDRLAPGTISHVGIYIGGGKMLNAGRNSPAVAGSVRVNDLTQPYWAGQDWTVRRVGLS